VKIALVSEGTYPYAMGGVSVWCDQLIRGMPDFRWEMIPLAVDGRERVAWELPDNLEGIRPVSLWGPDPTGRRGGRRVRPSFVEVYSAFLGPLLRPLDPRPDRAAEQRQEFIAGLRGLYDYAAAGGDLATALSSNEALTLMMDAWRVYHGDDVTLSDALEAAWLLEHMLRPLWIPAVSKDADVVHASMNGLSILVAIVAKWRYDIPIVMSEHGIYLRERYLAAIGDNSRHAVKVLILSFFRSLAGAGYVLADIVAPHSAYNRRWELQNGADPERMWTMYNGVALDEFPVAQSEPEVPTIAFMGRIDPLKDLHTLIKAFALVRKEIPEARLRMFGGTPAGNELYRDSCLRLIDELGLTGSAVLEGRVESPLEAYYAGTIVALTSSSEGFPYTVVEAMACGRPVVCTNVGGVAEAVGDTGFVVPARDSQGVADACVKLLTYGRFRAKLARAARERVVRLFTLQESLNAYRRIYRQLVEGEAALSDGYEVPVVDAVAALASENEIPVLDPDEALASENEVPLVDAVTGASEGATR
jgi:glycosyltransferase involved in cell wall biosynthesis